MEYITKGIILDKKEKGEDSEFIIFTEDLGKIYGQAVSARKITSKLASHLEPASFSQLRLIKKSFKDDFKIADALSEARKTDAETIKILEFVNQMTPLLQPDQSLFAFLKEIIKNKSLVYSQRTIYDQRPTYGQRTTSGQEAICGWQKKILKILGFDPNEAACDFCSSRDIAYFSSQDIMFLCCLCQKKSGLLEEKLLSL